MGNRGGQQDRRGGCLPLCAPAMGDGKATRISVSEMKSYYIYSEWCSWLLSVAEGESLALGGHVPLGHSRASSCSCLRGSSQGRCGAP